MYNETVSRSTPETADAPDAQDKNAAKEIHSTLFMNAGKRPLAKTLTLKDGKLNKKRSAPLTSGVTTHTVSSLEDFINIRPQLGAHCVCSYGVGPKGKKLIATKRAIDAKEAPPEAIARTKENFKWRAGPSIMLVDVDFSDGVFLTPQEIDADLCNAVDWWGGVKRVSVPSNSSSIHRKSDGALVSPKSGYHIYIIVDDGTKIPALGDEIFNRLAGGGAKIQIDRSVYTPGGLDYAFGPHIPPGQDLEQRSEPTWFDGAPMLDTTGKGCDSFDGTVQGGLPAALAHSNPDLNSELSGGMEESKPWDALSPEDKDACLAEMLQVPDVIAVAYAKRDPWLKIVTACARSGAPHAYEYCQEWSKLDKAQYNESDFDRDYESFRKSDGGIGIGTLIDAAKKGGWIPPWRRVERGGEDGAADECAQAGGGTDRQAGTQECLAPSPISSEPLPVLPWEPRFDRHHWMTWLWTTLTPYL